MATEQRLLARRRELDDDGFDVAWASLRELGALLVFDLEPWRTPGSRSSDFMREAPLRLVDLPLLLLDDLGLPDGDARVRLERSLLRAAALTAAAIFHAELVVGAEARYGPENALLHAKLVNAAAWHLAGAATDVPALARWSLAHWGEHAAALHEFRERRIGRVAPFSLGDIGDLGRRFAPLKTPLVCAAEHAGRTELLPALLPLVDEAAALFQLGRELMTIHQDLARGHCTAPIAVLLLGMGGLGATDTPPDVDRAVAAILLTRTLADLAELGRARTSTLREALAALGLDHVRSATDGLAAPFERVRDLYAGVAPSPSDPTRTTFAISHRPQLEVAIRAAQGFLTADPTHREAVEEYRWGFLGAPLLQSWVFPTGLILENRIEAGDECSAAVSALFETYAEGRFHYFLQPSSLPFDADSCALMLRLADHAADPERARGLLQAPLGWLLRNIRADGEVPVFMTDGVEAGDGRRYIASYGTRCAVVQAAVIVGLLRFDPDLDGGLIDRMIDHLHARIDAEGAGAFWYYDVPYGAHQILATCTAVREAGHYCHLEERLARIEDRMLHLLRAQRGLGAPSAQTAALLWLATRSPAARELRDPGWIERLLRSQRASGAWPSSPLYSGPTRGNLGEWYESRMVSTSFAYRALQTFARDEGGASRARWR